MTRGSVLAVDVPGAVHDALAGVVDTLGRLSVLDWLLVVGALALIAWGWLRARSFARLGSIEISDLAVDGSDFTPNAVKAALQQELAKRGWLPASGVPSGSPTVKAIGDAIAASPMDQAQWIGSLVSLLPTPPTATSFKLSGTLYAVRAGDDSMLGLSYQLDCLGPLPSTKLHETRRAEWPDVVDQASKDIYLAMGAAAPGMYPRWARWSDIEALTLYRNGLDLEQGHRPPIRKPAVGEPYLEAYTWFDAASVKDPENLLAPLRAATCLERAAGAYPRSREDERPDFLRIRALDTYTAIRLREPTIFEAGFRASVLLSSLADRCNSLSVERRDQLQGVVLRLDRAYDAEASTVPPQDLQAACYVAARRESKHAIRLLLAWWIPFRYGRFRNRYEPSGRERRQLHKAIAISRMCQRARVARSGANVLRAPVSDLTQFAWRAWVRYRYMAGRWYVAGWQAHYNAACFYALLPQASQPGTPFGDKPVRRRALAHLDRAVRQAGPDLARRYVKHEDRDLQVLRQFARDAFDDIVDRLPREG